MNIFSKAIPQNSIKSLMIKIERQKFRELTNAANIKFQIL